MPPPVLLQPDLKGSLSLVAEGKVRVIYELEDGKLFFVATDRISANDVVMNNGIPSKGRILTLLSAWWFNFLTAKIPHLKTHFITLDLPTSLAESLDNDARKLLQNRSMQVRRLKVFPIEAVVRGYITGSAWLEYEDKGTVNGIDIDSIGLGDREVEKTGREGEIGEEGKRERRYKECERLAVPLYTPSTKAEVGGVDVNIHPDEAAKIVGEKYAKRIEELSIEIYKHAHTHALTSASLIIADTKFEFGLDPATDDIYLVDEVLTPDSSRFWPLESYAPGKPQRSFDKQFLRDWLAREGLKGVEGVVVDEEVVEMTRRKYVDAYERVTGVVWDGD